MTQASRPQGTDRRLFDVLLPYYGDVDHMKASVRSVLAQTGDDWHLTVVDDGYPDPSVATWFGTLDDPRVTYLRNAENLGANLNYVKATSLAVAPHLVVMGADDLMLPGYLARMRAIVSAQPDVAVIQPGVTVIDGQGRPTDPLTDRVKRWSRPRTNAQRVLTGEHLAASLLRGNWTYFPSLCWRTDVVKGLGFRDGLNVVQDLALLMDVTLSGGSLVLDPEPTFAYRRHAGSDSAVRAVSGDRFREEARYFASVADLCGQRGWHRAERAARVHLTSRLHAISLLPAAVEARSASAGVALLRHAVGW